MFSNIFITVTDNDGNFHSINPDKIIDMFEISDTRTELLFYDGSKMIVKDTPSYIEKSVWHKIKDRLSEIAFYIN